MHKPCNCWWFHRTVTMAEESMPLPVTRLYTRRSRVNGKSCCTIPPSSLCTKQTRVWWVLAKTALSVCLGLCTWSLQLFLQRSSDSRFWSRIKIELRSAAASLETSWSAPHSIPFEIDSRRSNSILRNGSKRCAPHVSLVCVAFMFVCVCVCVCFCVLCVCVRACVK